MHRIRVLPALLGGIAVLGVAFLLYSVAQQLGAPGGARNDSTTTERPVDVFRMDGISYTAQDGGHVWSRLKADRIEVAKRKFGIVYVNPLKEASLTNVELEIHERNGAWDSDNLLDLFREVLPPDLTKEIGIVTRIRITGLTVKMVRNGQVASSITAQRALIDPKTRVTELSGRVVVAAADGRSVISQKSTWDRDTGLFWISGSYLYQQAGKMVKGNGARFDAELRGVRL
jgi:hypothetical protein